MEETQWNRGHPYQLRSSKSVTKTRASNMSFQPKLNIELQGEDKAQGDQPRGYVRYFFGLFVANSTVITLHSTHKRIISGREEAKRRVPTGAELERHRERMLGFANKALGWLQSIGGPEYRVVKVLKNSLGNRPHGLLRHLNFDAQRQGDPNAPVELFFAEFLSTKGNPDAVEICRPLGHSDIMKQTYADIRGCSICRPNTVYHPPKGHFGCEIKGDD